MPESNPSSEPTFIWLIACILLISILAGGGCLVAYMVLPESQTTSWVPVVGVALVGLPWAFWIFTFLYRIFSRCCGCRIRIDVANGGGGKGGGGGGCWGAANATGNADVKVAAQANGERKMGVAERGLDRASSVASHESEMALANTMAS